MLVLSGIAIVVFGFLVRADPLLVVAVAAPVTALSAGLHPVAVLAVPWPCVQREPLCKSGLPSAAVIGLLERHGLQERAKMLIMRLRGATAGRPLSAYLLFRQVLASVGLTAIGGHPQMVRPLIAPMAEAAAVRAAGEDDTTTHAFARLPRRPTMWARSSARAYL